MSPELLDPDKFGLKEGRPTKESDCYALGMVIYEVLSGQTPFAPSAVPVVIRKVLEGERPVRPQREEGKLFTDAIWRALELCWKPWPSDRTSAKVVLLGLGGNPPSGVDGDWETDADDQSDSAARDSRMVSPFPLRCTCAHPGGTQDCQLHNVTTGSPPNRHGAARRGHESVRYRVVPGESSGL